MGTETAYRVNSNGAINNLGAYKKRNLKKPGVRYRLELQARS
jgi:hypothetical protein